MFANMCEHEAARGCVAITRCSGDTTGMGRRRLAPDGACLSLSASTPTPPPPPFAHNSYARYSVHSTPHTYTLEPDGIYR